MSAHPEPHDTAFRGFFGQSVTVREFFGQSVPSRGDAEVSAARSSDDQWDSSPVRKRWPYPSPTFVDSVKVPADQRIRAKETPL